MGPSASEGTTRMWALLQPDGTYRTNRTYESGHMSPHRVYRSHLFDVVGAHTPIHSFALLAPSS
jgi:hypothetical protein